MKKVLIVLTVIVAIIVAFLFYPTNYYLRKAIVHQLPTIDQYPIFENRVIEANDPQPWHISPKFNSVDLPEEQRPAFEELETVAFLVIRDSLLLFEEYWEDYSPGSLSNSFSMAKSIVSLAIGCAIDDGAIQGVDQPVSDFIPEFPGYDGKTLTIRHLLTMSAGVDYQEAYTSPFSPTTKLYYGNDLRRITMGMKEIETPGVNVVYQSAVTQLLAFILEKATGETLSHYVSRKLWTPMQAEENALWSLDRKEGMEKAYCCFNSNARDFARFGQLILNQGSWNNQQLVSQDYLIQAITPDTTLQYEGDPNHYYGYQYWHLTYKGIPVYYMRGIYGQYVFAIPERNAVIVRLGHQRSETRTTQRYPDDIDIWLETGFAIMEMVED